MAHKVSTVGQPIGFKVLGFFDKSRLGFSPKEIDLKGQKNEGTYYPFFTLLNLEFFGGLDNLGTGIFLAILILFFH